MRVVASNCGCCGIKHIRDFTRSPDDYVYANQSSGHDEDQSSSSPEPYGNWDNHIPSLAGNHPAGEVFKALVEQIKERRPSGMITLNLVAEEDYHGWCCEDCNGPKSLWTGGSDFDYEQIENWHPLLTELGFDKVTFKNSNSSNEIHHYTLVYDEE